MSANELRPKRSRFFAREAHIHEAIGKRLRRLRQEQAYTVKDTALSIGIYPSSLCKIESGKTRISVVQLVRLARLLNCPVSDILEDPDAT